MSIGIVLKGFVLLHEEETPKDSKVKSIIYGFTLVQQGDGRIIFIEVNKSMYIVIMIVP